MNVLDFIDSMPLTQALGWTLVHFLWQGTVLAAALAVVLSLMRRAGANARYLVCCAGMLLMMIAPIVTLGLVLRATARPIAALADDLLLPNLDSIPIWDRISQYLPAITLCWLAGVLVFQGRLLAHWLGARRLRRCGTTSAPQRWQRTVNDLCGQLGMRGRVEIMVSSLAAVPMVLGWLKPVILVPAGALSGLTASQLKTIIVHELAHVRRHDYLINLIQAVFESLLFYHPAVWWLSNRLRVEREYCCDDVAVRTCGDALCYARALSSLETLRTSGTEPALASTGGPLMTRIFRIVNARTKPTGRMGGWIAPIVIALSLTVATSTMVFASPGKPEKPPHREVQKKKAIDQVDVVAIAKKAGAKRAKTLAALREAGLDNETLLTVLAQLEQDPAIVKAVEHAAQETASTKTKMREYEQQLIKKMKAEGASDKEIKKAIAEYRQKVQKKASSDPKSELAAKEEHLVKKMKAEGASDKEIKQAVMKLRDKYAYMQLSDEDKAFVDKMIEAGYSRDDISKALYERQVKMKGKQQEQLAAKEEHLIKKLKADGASKEEIKKAIAEFRKKTGFAPPPPPKAGELEIKEKKLIEKMKADGASKEEIKEAIAKLHASYKQPPVKKVKLKVTEDDMKLIEKMEAAGMSKEEIMRVLKALHSEEAI